MDGPPAPVTAAQLLALTRDCAITASSHPYPISDGTLAKICALEGAVFWKAGMNIDCDGKPTAGKCDHSVDPDFTPDTAFHNPAGQPLTSAVTPYVVIPEDFRYPGFDGTKGGNVVAVIYEDRLTYAVWGDTGNPVLLGEASYACAKKLGIDPDPLLGGIAGAQVTYIAFSGPAAVPTNIEDRAETTALGAKLAAQLVASNK
jgi:hypothetical protein